MSTESNLNDAQMSGRSASDLTQALEEDFTKTILIYGINYAPEPIGVGRYSGELGSYLTERGYAVGTVTSIPHYPGWAVRDGYRNFYGSERIDGVHVIRCPIILREKMGGIWRFLAPISFALTSAPIVIWNIIIHRPNTVLCVEPTLFSSPLALLCAKLIGSRTVLHVQDLEVDAAFATGYLNGRLLRKMLLKIEGCLLRQFDCVVTISYRMKEKLIEKGGQGEKIGIVRNWVDLQKITPIDGVSEFRKELGISDQDCVVLYAGNVGTKQALDILLDAALRLSERDKIKFVIAGDGPAKENLILKYGHLKNLIFLPVQAEHRLCQLLNLADLHVLPQLAGMADLVLPSKLGGMLASGRPCLVMADPGTELHSFLNGVAILTPAGDAFSLAQNIDDFSDSNDRPNVEEQLKLAQMFDSRRSLREFERYLFEDFPNYTGSE